MPEPSDLGENVLEPSESAYTIASALLIKFGGKALDVVDRQIAEAEHDMRHTWVSIRKAVVAASAPEWPTSVTSEYMSDSRSDAQ